MNWKAEISRRPLLSGLAAALGLGLAGTLVYEVPRLAHGRYKRTKFDDLLSQLDDRDNAARLGAVVIAGRPGFDAEAAAERLRRGPGKGSLARAVQADIAAARLAAVHGWLIPESLAAAAAIAAKSQ